MHSSSIIFPGQCHTVISNLAITRIILSPFYNAAVYTAYSEPTMHCIHLISCMSDGECNWRAKRANLVILCARFFSIYIFPGQCHTVISNLAITRIILNPFYNAAAYSEPTMHCIHLVIGERERANIIVQRAGFFSIYIYLRGRCHTANRHCFSKLTQCSIFHKSSPRVYSFFYSDIKCVVSPLYSCYSLR